MNEVKILNQGEKFDKEKYSWALGDYDGDGTKNIDDISPMDSSITGTIEDRSLADSFEDLVEKRESFNQKMFDAVDEIKTIAPSDSNIYARTKTPYSIIAKLIKKRLLDKKNPKKGLTDVVGTTIAVEDQEELDMVRDQIENSEKFEVLEVEDFYETPLGGYRAIHYILIMDGFPVELQLKTKRMKQINELSHGAYAANDLNTKNLERLTSIAYKADKGEKESIDLFNNLMSDADEVENSLYVSREQKFPVMDQWLPYDERAQSVVQKFKDGGVVERGAQWQQVNNPKFQEGGSAKLSKSDLENQLAKIEKSLKDDLPMMKSFRPNMLKKKKELEESIKELELASKKQVSSFQKDFEDELSRQKNEGIVKDDSEGISIMGMMKGKDDPVKKKTTKSKTLYFKFNLGELVISKNNTNVKGVVYDRKTEGSTNSYKLQDEWGGKDELWRLESNLKASPKVKKDSTSEMLDQLEKEKPRSKRTEGLSKDEKMVIQMMPINQRKAVQDQILKVQKEYVKNQVENNKNLKGIYSQDGKGEKAIVYARYFTPSGTEIYVTEMDWSGLKPKEAFGFQVLNGDWEMAEFGYIDLKSIIFQNYGMKSPELDLYFEPVELRKIINSEGLPIKKEAKKALLKKDTKKPVKEDVKVIKKDKKEKKPTKSAKKNITYFKFLKIFNEINDTKISGPTQSKYKPELIDALKESYQLYRKTKEFGPIMVKEKPMTGSNKYTKSKKMDQQRSALPCGIRISKNGQLYDERRSNRCDINDLIKNI